MSSNDKSRASSGGRSLFSRSKHKDKRSTEESKQAQNDNYDAASMMSSRSSRHHRESSISMDPTHSPDLNQMSGVITTIPYETMPGSRSPVPMDYLPKGDQGPLRREPVPHQLTRPGVDYHQYPAYDSTNNNSTPRPGTGNSNYTMASTGRHTQYQQWGPARSSNVPGSEGAHNPRYDSYLTANGRSSADTMSMHSSKLSR